MTITAAIPIEWQMVSAASPPAPIAWRVEIDGRWVVVRAVGVVS